MANYDASIRVKTEIVNDKAMIDLRTLENRMEKVRQKTEALVKKKKELEAFTIKTAEYEVLEKQLVDATSKFDELLNKQKELPRLYKKRI